MKRSNCLLSHRAVAPAMVAWLFVTAVAARGASAQIGACCLGNGTCVDTTSAGCTTLSGEFIGDGTDCATTVCLGACCTANKQCVENNRDFCIAAPGSFQGAGSTCELNCPSFLATAFTYQGQLKEGGVPVTDTIDLEATLWTAAVGGDQVGPTLRLDGQVGNQPPIEVVNGLFTLELDFGANAFNGNARFLELAVRRPHDPGDTEAFTTLEPRKPLTQTPYAGFASRPWESDKVNVFYTTGNVGVGTASPTARLDVLSSGETAVRVATNWIGVYGIHQGNGTFPGVWGETDSTSSGGSGVRGFTTAATGATYGVYGKSDSTSGRGVFGLSTAATGATYGVYGESNSPDGYAGYFAGRGFFNGNVEIGQFQGGTGISVVENYTRQLTLGGEFNSGANAPGSVKLYIGEYDNDNDPASPIYPIYVEDENNNVQLAVKRTFGERSCLISGSDNDGTVAALMVESGIQRMLIDGNEIDGITDLALNHNSSANVLIANGGGRVGIGTATPLSSSRLHVAADAGRGTTYGVYGQSDSTAGRGVYGQATATSGTTYGGRFESASTSGRGVYGQATAGSGITYGGWFESDSTSGVGVRGFADASSGVTYGGWFESDSTSGIGVFGLSTANTGTTYGVLGRTFSPSASAYGVFASGNMGASGVKSFRIDHPDDPSNKYLLHYAAESPEVINFYSGKATLDATGEAVVELPHYFAKINKDPRYTLTAVGAPMPMLHVAEEIDEAALSAGATAGAGVAAPVCTFRIAGGAPGAKVSWEVKAVRNDLWVQNHIVSADVVSNGVSIQTRAMPVEIEKEGVEKGTYQHPEFYGQPAEKGMNYDAERAERDLPDHPDAERPASRILLDTRAH